MSKNDRPDPGFFAQKNRKAIHFLDLAKFPGGEVLCGFALGEKKIEWAERTTKSLDQVRCWVCVQRLRGEGRLK